MCPSSWCSILAGFWCIVTSWPTQKWGGEKKLIFYAFWWSYLYIYVLIFMSIWAVLSKFANAPGYVHHVALLACHSLGGVCYGVWWLDSLEANVRQTQVRSCSEKVGLEVIWVVLSGPVFCFWHFSGPELHVTEVDDSWRLWWRLFSFFLEYCDLCSGVVGIVFDKCIRFFILIAIDDWRSPSQPIQTICIFGWMGVKVRKMILPLKCDGGRLRPDTTLIFYFSVYHSNPPFPFWKNLENLSSTYISVPKKITKKQKWPVTLTIWPWDLTKLHNGNPPLLIPSFSRIFLGPEEWEKRHNV